MSDRDFAMEVVARLAKRYEETEPPYMFPDAVNETFPGMGGTTIGEALNDVWESAFDQAQEVVLGMVKEQKEER